MTTVRSSSLLNAVAALCVCTNQQCLSLYFVLIGERSKLNVFLCKQLEGASPTFISTQSVTTMVPPLLSTSPLSLHPIFSILIPRARLLWNGEPQNLACGRLLSTRARWSKVVPQCKQNLTVGDCEFRALVFELQGVQADGALKRCVVWTLNRNLLFFHEMY